MKRIVKKAEPTDYKQWRLRVSGTDKSDYREMPLKIKEVLLKALVEEQGRLCAYTMKRIDAKNSAHVEHYEPQTVCRKRKQGSDLVYRNLHACFPRAGMEEPYRYGAQKRADWWENEGKEFVSPCDANCERRFSFNLEGEIKAVNDSAAAKKTIEKLALDHTSLTEDRRRVIREFVYGENGDDPLPVAKATSATVAVCKRGSDGSFNEFCVAIRDGIHEHVKNVKRLAAKKKHAKKQAKTKRKK